MYFICRLQHLIMMKCCVWWQLNNCNVSMQFKWLVWCFMLASAMLQSFLIISKNEHLALIQASFNSLGLLEKTISLQFLSHWKCPTDLICLGKNKNTECHICWLLEASSFAISIAHLQNVLLIFNQWAISLYKPIYKPASNVSIIHIITFLSSLLIIQTISHLYKL